MKTDIPIFSGSQVSCCPTPTGGFPVFNPDCAVESVARRRKPQRNAQLEATAQSGLNIALFLPRETSFNFTGAMYGAIPICLIDIINFNKL